MTNKQKIFCENYLSNGFNATKAAIDAGYSEHTARNIGAVNLTKPEVAEYLDKSIKDKLSRLDDTALRLLKLVERVAYFDMRKLMSWGADGVILKESDELSEDDAIMISEIAETKSSGGGTLKVKTISKEKAIEILAKFSKLIDGEHEEPQTGIDQMSREEREERLAYLLEKRNGAR